MPQVLLTGKYGEVFLPGLRAQLPIGWSVETWSPAEGKDALLERVRLSEVLVPSAEYVYTGWAPESLAAAERLRMIQIPFSGFDWLDRRWLPAGVHVCNVDVHAGPIAEFVLLGMLEMVINMRRMDRDLRRGVWELGGSMVLGRKHRELHGRTLGILGYGRIGREIAVRARAFGMSTIAVSRSPRAAGDPALDEWLALPELNSMLSRSDFLVIACPLSDETRGLINAERLGAMKQTAALINIARSPIVDEAALFSALREGRLSGALIDVWGSYPTPEAPTGVPSKTFPFHELDNVIVTPHCASWTEELEQRRIAAVTSNILRHIASGPLNDTVLTT